MSDMNDWNTWNKSVIAEFRASEGRVGGDLEGMPMVLVHHLGRKSGRQYVNPLAYLPGENDDSIYVFASKGGAPTQRGRGLSGGADDAAGLDVFDHRHEEQGGGGLSPGSASG